MRNLSLTENDITDILKQIYTKTLNTKKHISKEEIFNNIIVEAIEKNSIAEIKKAVYKKYDI